jgi:AcrR family transcriptional regulator
MTSAKLQRTVLDASIALIASDGVTALSLREVARRAGVSHQAPYHHFGDREGILAAIALEGFTILGAGMRKRLAALADGDPGARLEAVGASYIDFALRHPAHFQVMFRADLIVMDRHPTLKATADDTFNQLLEVVSDVAERHGRGDPLPLAIAAWSLAHGLSTLFLEGKLEHRLGKGRKHQREGIAKALRAFRDLLG